MGIPYSIGEAKALAKSHHDPYIREMLEWLIERAEGNQGPRRYLYFRHRTTPTYLRFIPGPVIENAAVVELIAFDDKKSISNIYCSEDVTGLRLYDRSPQMESVWNCCALWFSEIHADEEISKFKKDCTRFGPYSTSSETERS
jgi:hypothetical protein